MKINLLIFFVVAISTKTFSANLALSKHASKIEYEELLKDLNWRDDFPFLYSLVLSDSDAFKMLQNFFDKKWLDTWQIIDVIASIVVEGFPHGLPPKNALDSLNHLLESLGDDAKGLRTRVDSAIEDLKQEGPALKRTLSVNGLQIIRRGIYFSASEKLELARAYSAIEAKFLSRITPGEFSLWLADEKRGETIHEYQYFNEQMRFLFSLFIVSGESPKERLKGAQQLLEFGLHLLQMNNYSGTQTVVSVFTQSSVKRLVKLDSKSKLILKKMQATLGIKSNYKPYRVAIEKDHDDLCMPILGVFLNDIKLAFDKSLEVHHAESLFSFVHQFKIFNDHRLKAKDYTEYCNTAPRVFDDLPPIPEELVDAFAMANHPEAFKNYLARTTRKAVIEKCDEVEMVRALFAMKLPGSAIITLFRAGIYNGNDLERFLLRFINRFERKDALLTLGFSQEQALILMYNFQAKSIFDV